MTGLSALANTMAPMGDNISPVKAKKRRRPPVVMTKTEVRQVLNQMKGTHLLMAKVMYGGGLRAFLSPTAWSMMRASFSRVMVQALIFSGN